MPNECLPPHLQDRLHEDWPYPFNSIPRGNTAWCGDPPTVLAGVNRDVPGPGQFTVQRANIHNPPAWMPLIYIAQTSWFGFHTRIGPRYDRIDKYYNFPSVAGKMIETWLCKGCGAVIYDPVEHTDSTHGGIPQALDILRPMPWDDIFRKMSSLISGLK
jgi:hypothetical protein